MPEMRSEDQIDELLDYDADLSDPSGTSRVGTLRNTTRNELRRHFGEPAGPFGKVADHWTVRFPDGSKACIYDYRQKNRFADDNEPRDWSVGGTSSEVIELLRYLGLDVQSYSAEPVAV